MLPTKTDDNLTTTIDHHAVLCPTRSPAALAKPAQAPAAGPTERIQSHEIRDVVVLEVIGRLSEVVKDLDRAIELALAEGPRGVVCDLSGAVECAEPGAVEMLATAGRHVRDWPGIPVAVACADQRVRDALAAHRLGGQLILTTSMFSAVSMTLVTPTPAAEWVRLAPNPTAPRASRAFVTRTLQGWGLDALVVAANLVVSELVTDATTAATKDIELSIAWNLRALRLTVRDTGASLPDQPYGLWDLNGPRLTAVADLSRAYGVLPTADGGKVAWAVLNAARPRHRRPHFMER